MFFGNRGRYRRGGGGNDIFLAMMFMQLLHQIERLPYKPPITLFLMGLMAVVFYFPQEFFGHHHDTMSIAFHPILIYEAEHWQRFWLSPFVHANAYHLYYNLSSFLYKGVALESILGEKFAFVILGVLALSQTVFLLLSYGFAYLEWMPLATRTYTVGFSGVIFALKVLVNQLDEGLNGVSFNQVLGLNLPWNKVVWVELVIAHFASPGSSLLGHFSGIVAGFLFLPILNLVMRVEPFFDFYREARFHGSGTASHNPPPVNHRPVGNEPAPNHHAPSSVSQVEMRRRRLARFT